jgi:hypothetical protein
MSIVIGNAPLFGSGHDINEDNLILPNDCIFWKVHQSNEEFTTCVTVCERDGRHVRELHYVAEVEGSDPPMFSLDFQQSWVSSKANTWFDTIKNGQQGTPPLGERVLAWVTFCAQVNVRDEWRIVTVTKEGKDRYNFKADDFSTTLSLAEYQSLRWCYMPPEQTNRQP